MLGRGLRFYSGGVVSLVAGAAFFMLYPERPLVFDMAPRVVHDALRQTGLPPLVFGTLTTGAVIVNSDTSITWSVRENGREMMRYTALLKPEPDNRTRVTLDFRSGARGDALTSAERLDRLVTIRKLYLTAIKERIASAVEGRSYNMVVLYPMTMVATLANSGEMMGRLDAVARQDAARSQANIRKAYREGDGR